MLYTYNGPFNSITIRTKKGVYTIKRGEKVEIDEDIKVEGLEKIEAAKNTKKDMKKGSKK